MSESYRTTPADQPWSSSRGPETAIRMRFGDASSQDDETGEAGKVVLAGVLGGLFSAAGYMIYRRLPDEQKEQLHSQVRSVVQQRITEIRKNFNI